MEKVRKKLKDHQSAKAQVQKWKMERQTIVFTNGCFDILHLGHVDYLEKAKNLGDRLIVGLNTDESVKRLKGTNRPIQDQHARAVVLASLQFVDLVVFFEENIPLSLISELTPDILVKGSDYLADEIVGAEIVKKNNGIVKTLDLIPGYSTTALIDRIKNT